jgi:putative redox protein
MNAILNWDGAMGFECAGGSGHKIKTDVDVAVGGKDSGARPMELLLFALGGCAGADVVDISRKMKQPLEKLIIELEGERADEHPKRFTRIHMIFRAYGKSLNLERIEHAVELSQTKYCSVSATLNCPVSSEVILSR